MGSVLLAAGLVAYNSIANRWKPFHGWAYVPANVTLAAAVVAIGVWGFDLDRATIGARWESGWIGAVLAAAAMVPVSLLLTFERGRALLRDRRLADVRGRSAAYMIAIRIPVGTALVEEIAFRGVLLGSWLHVGTTQAVVASSIAFGLWHVVPTMILARTNRLRPVVVPAGILLTTGVGLFLGWLRIETGSLAAPFLTHALFNSLGAGAALIALSTGDRPPSRSGLR